MVVPPELVDAGDDLDELVERGDGPVTLGDGLDAIIVIIELVDYSTGSPFRDQRSVKG